MEVDTGQVVEIQLYSVLRERMKSSVIAVSVKGETQADALLDLVCVQHPQIAAYRSLMHLAINQIHARPDDSVKPGDEVALITPVSGG